MFIEKEQNIISKVKTRNMQIPKANTMLKHHYMTK